VELSPLGERPESALWDYSLEVRLTSTGRETPIAPSGPHPATGTENPGGAHGDDERLRESSLYQEVEFLWKSVVRVAAS
jgi:hypothetical protein